MPKLKSHFAQSSHTAIGLYAALALVTALGLASCSKTPAITVSPEMIKPAAPAGFMSAGDSDPELIAVKEQAQTKLGEFTGAFAKRGSGEQFLIKAPFKEGPYE